MLFGDNRTAQGHRHLALQRHRTWPVTLHYQLSYSYTVERPARLQSLQRRAATPGRSYVRCSFRRGNRHLAIRVQAFLRPFPSTTLCVLFVHLVRCSLSSSSVRPHRHAAHVRLCDHADRRLCQVRAQAHPRRHSAVSPHHPLPRPAHDIALHVGPAHLSAAEAADYRAERHR
jgi:hypothetical protein